MKGNHVLVTPKDKNAAPVLKIPVKQDEAEIKAEHAAKLAAAKKEAEEGAKEYFNSTMSISIQRSTVHVHIYVTMYIKYPD
jgi:hypothetical protein